MTRWSHAHTLMVGLVAGVAASRSAWLITAAVLAAAVAGYILGRVHRAALTITRGLALVGRGGLERVQERRTPAGGLERRWPS